MNADIVQDFVDFQGEFHPDYRTERDGYLLSYTIEGNESGGRAVLRATKATFGRLATNSMGVIRWHGDQDSSARRGLHSGKRFPTDHFMRQARCEILSAARQSFRRWLYHIDPCPEMMVAGRWPKKMNVPGTDTTRFKLFLGESKDWPGKCVGSGWDALVCSEKWRQASNSFEIPLHLPIAHAKALVLDLLDVFNEQDEE